MKKSVKFFTKSNISLHPHKRIALHLITNRRRFSMPGINNGVSRQSV